ncbi:maleylpyruvate isomerase family mycothiol-dependent enzyme [Microbispora sp. RL4-1S]|uniref:Maleylpyruvate isomerase family mycothiol-dependent enzyme n=1 Tax=Microbispora oryzae TaxID=2806554 RepID=A0A941AMP5_9ACTN|nr:maleylpyruvate isomerase family mycothiol-dependent enzyme [Microbispora oryzae]MBP2707518.1 maleylpyruvate isomerase family mycothiol-dependent enzyme [Microbispora oryzae]
MTDRADQPIKTLRAGADDLASFVRSRTPDDLARGSGASEWDVSQVLSHLGSGAEISLATLEGALAGGGAPEREWITGVWARWDGRSRTERAEAFLDANEALVSRLEGLDEETRERLRVPLWFPGDPLDLAGFVGMRLTEFTYHVWDVKVAFDPEAALDPAAVDLLVDNAGTLLRWAGKAEGLGGRRATIEVRLGSPERVFGLEIGEAVAVADVPAEPDAVLTAPAEWWLRLVSGRHAPEHTPANVELIGKSGGDALTIDDLRRVFPGF